MIYNVSFILNNNLWLRQYGKGITKRNIVTNLKKNLSLDLEGIQNFYFLNK